MVNQKIDTDCLNLHGLTTYTDTSLVQCRLERFSFHIEDLNKSCMLIDSAMLPVGGIRDSMLPRLKTWDLQRKANC